MGKDKTKAETEAEIVFVRDQYPQAAEFVREQVDWILDILHEKFGLTSKQAIELYKQMFQADF